jgi:hypothetical protein
MLPSINEFKIPIFTFAYTIFRCVILTNVLYTYRQNTTVVLDVVSLFINPSLHVSAFVRPSSGSLGSILDVLDNIPPAGLMMIA